MAMQKAPKTRPKLTLKIPLLPLLSSPKPTFPSSNPREKQLKSPSRYLIPTPPAPTTATPTPDNYPLIPKLHPCLQCHILGLKCSLTTPFHILPPRMRLHAWHVRPEAWCCVRCRRNWEEFCVVREMGDEGEEEVGYKAYGVEEEILEEMVEGMWEEKGKVGRWALPESDERHRESVNPGRWQWEREGRN